jgi:ABC-type transport system involved in multi-copper enzyme maturation permease subunit
MSEDRGLKIEDRGSQMEDRGLKANLDPWSSILEPRSSTASPSATRAWFYLVWFSIQRQARARQMILIALGLFVLTLTIILFVTARGGWTMEYYRWRWVNPEVSRLEKQGRAKEIPPDVVRSVVLNYRETVDGMGLVSHVLPGPRAVGDLPSAVATAYGMALKQSGIYVFTNLVVYLVFVAFLLPFWSLSFATEALGGERESRSLVWLLSRPMSRPAIYAAKFVALLPWTLGFNLGGFAILCLAAGAPGRQAFGLFWPAVAAASLAFCSLFYLMSAVFRRPAVVAICYSFFLEIILGMMPGYMKRASIGFYTRCMMFDAGETAGLLPPEKPSIYMPVDGVTALTVLLGITATLLVLGMLVFARSEYWEDL